MCIFSGSVASVTDTKIFVSARPGLRTLVYQMAATASRDAPVAMILPIPARSGLEFFEVPNDAFFRELAELFPRSRVLQARSRGLTKGFQPVVRVGDYLTSVIHSPDELSQLDPVLEANPQLVATLQEKYQFYEFAVFQFSPKNGRVRPSPLGLRYVPADDGLVMFPTLHVHDGHHMPPKAEFDHELYLQGFGDYFKNFDNGFKEELWQAARVLPEEANIDFYSSPFLSPTDRICRLPLDGIYPNKDCLLTAS